MYNYFGSIMKVAFWVKVERTVNVLFVLHDYKISPLL